MTSTTETSTSPRKPGYYEFAQDEHYVVRLGQINEGMPIVSDGCLFLLKEARSNVNDIRGWEILPYEAKIALIGQDIWYRIIMKARTPEEEILSEDRRDSVKESKAMEAFAWEALKFLECYVCDVYPFRDNYPEPSPGVLVDSSGDFICLLER